METFEMSELMESVLRERTAGRMTPHEFGGFIAEQASRNLRWSLPERYPEFHNTLKQYCEQRMRGVERDPDFHRRINDFVLRCIRVREENKSRLASLRWAVTQLESLGLTQRAEIMGNAIVEFLSMSKAPEGTTLAVDVLILDSEAKANSVGHEPTKRRPT